MKKGYEDGGEIDAMEEANKRTDRTLTNPNAKEYGESGTSYTTKATPKKAAPKPAAKAAPKLIDPSNIRSGRREFEESQMAPADKTKMSVAERAKASRESARAGSGTTDRRSVGERLKSAFGMKSGGSVGSASRRADGIATKGKTRGKMC
jgi:hypothetical protein